MQNIELPAPLYKVELVVKGKSHFYDVTHNDVIIRYPGVTGILSVIAKPALIPWAKKEALSSVESALMERLNGKKSARIALNKAWIQSILEDAKQRPEQIKDEAADLGSQVHTFIDLIIHGEEPEKIPDEISAPVNAFKNWWKSSGIELVMGDTLVASIQYKYGGSLDALGYKDGRFIILDFKTSNAIYSEYALQVAAYGQAFLETYGMECKEAIIVRFSKNQPVEFEKKEVADLKQSFEAFLAAKNLKESLMKSHFIEW